MGLLGAAAAVLDKVRGCCLAAVYLCVKKGSHGCRTALGTKTGLIGAAATVLDKVRGVQGCCLAAVWLLITRREPRLLTASGESKKKYVQRSMASGMALCGWPRACLFANAQFEKQ
jgi:hypothetical protein